jgi:cyanophycinase-like exopeptidase
MDRIVLSILFLISFFGFGQSYTSYLTGSATDIVTSPAGGVCLMGGATEDDNAMKWFLQRANGGDVLVLRTTGSDGYNSYLYSGLGITVNSVETIVCNNSSASTDPYVLQKIQQAEAIWFAGGNQWTYISYWRNSPLDSAINQAILQRNIVIGGTSAGMAIQGNYYFSAQNGTVTSSTALANPFNSLVTVDSSTFIHNNFLDNTITDTHFDNPDRKGRIVTFLARIHADYGVYANAIACDEYTSVCIDTLGIARVFGGHPTYDDNAYFIQANCGLTILAPENCSSGNPLTWDLGGLALKTYQIKGDDTGSKTFDLNTWQSGSGGTWFNWSVSNGVFSEQTGAAINCSPLSVNHLSADSEIEIYPNPTADIVTMVFNGDFNSENQLSIYTNLGQQIYVPITTTNNQLIADLKNLDNGIYRLHILGENGKLYQKKLFKNR